MKVYFDRKVIIGFFLALGILAILGIYSYKNSQDSIKTSRMISHTNDVIYRIEKLHSMHLEIEAELMRFIISGDTVFQSFIQHSLNEAKEHFFALQNLVDDNATQKELLDSIRILGTEKMNFIQQVIGARRQSEESAKQLLPFPRNRKLLEGINKSVEDMQAEEKKLLDIRMNENQREVAKFQTTFITLVIATVLIILTLFLTINATLQARLNAEKSLSIAADEIKELYNNAPCGYHSLDADGLIVAMNKTWLEWTGYDRRDVVNKMAFSDLLAPKSQEIFQNNFPLFKSQGSIKNLELEVICKNNTLLVVIINSTAIKDENNNFIKSRSTVFNITDRHEAEEKVIAANNELEAFSYSVSHDLRAPLRSIDGYSKILQEDYAPSMEAEANRLLQIIRNNARRMGQLIDDLLDFSRLGRKDLEKSTVNMHSLVVNVKQELMAQEKDRAVEFVINDLEEVHSDIRMMRQVWINLISNAIKYSRKQALATIEIGSSNDKNSIIYYIRDNGVGFDMKYADKLFGVFQRLHKMEEFEGTGVGLALVHRIISRHGGKIWVEAGVNQGATFFFCIPTQNINLNG